MDDLRISTVDHEAASHDFASGGRDASIAADISSDHLLPLSQNADVAAFEVAQTEEQQANGKTGRLSANDPQNAVARQPVQIVPDNGNVVHLPPNTSIDDIHVEGRNLVLVQADGTRIIIINGALHVPTFLIGEVTLPQQAVVAALQQQGINVAEGPDGSVHAGNSTDSGHQFTDSQAGNARTPLNLIGLLGPGDIIGGGNGANLSGTQTRVPFIDQQATETASLIESGSSTGAFLTTSSTGRFGFGGNNAAITTVTLVGEAEITGSGTQQLSGLTSGGIPVVVTQSGQTVTGVANGLTVFTLVFNASTGDYTFTQLAALDHPRGANASSDVLQLQFRYTVSDTSGHIVASVASVDITDSVPVAAAGTAGSVTEAALASGNAALSHDTGAAAATGSLNISWGADSSNSNQAGLGDRSVAFTSATVAAQGRDGEALSSHGLAVHTALLADGTLVGYTGEAAPTATSASNIVFYATVSDTDNGHYNFTLVQSLDDAKGSDAIKLTFGYTATDSDGDSATNTFTVTVADDKPVAATGDAGSVTEGALASGNENPHVGTDAVTTGSLNISWGADNANTDQSGAGDRSVAFTSATVAAQGQDGEALSSHGLAVHTVLLADGTLVGYTGETAPTTVADAKGVVGSNIIFYATVSDTDNGHYNFTLVQSLDDAKGSDAIKLTFGYTATDSDGDSATNTFTVTVADDKPVAATGDAGSVTEGALASGNENPHVGTDAVTTGSLNISWGADNANTDQSGAGDRSVAFTSATVAAQGQDGEALSSHGIAVHTALLADGTLVGYTGEAAPTAISASNVVFYATVSDTDNGHYNFTLVQSLDDAKGSDAIKLTFGYTATDSDGDSATNTFIVTVADDKPVAATGDAGSVTEGALASGNENPHVGTDAVATGSLNISWGADNANTDQSGAGDRSVAFTSATVAAQGQDGEALSSHGIAVHTALLADGTLVGYTGEAAPTTVADAKGVVGSNIVFYATVSDTDNGHYNFTLVQSLDDAKGSDAIKLTFGYTATDSDGDSATNTFTVTVADDKPVASDVTVGTGSLYDTAAEQMSLRPIVELSEEPTPSEGATDTVSGGSGSLFTAGADGFQQVTFTDPTGLKGIYIDVNGVAHKEGLSYNTTTDNLGNTIYTATGKESGHVLFTLTVGADGSYTYVQSGAFADAKGSDNENFKISFEVTDGDGDKAIGSLMLNVADSLPVANNVTADSGVLHDTASASSGTNAPSVKLLLEQPSEGATPTDGTKSNADGVSGASGSLFTTGADGFARLTFSNPTGLKAINIGENGVAHTEGLHYSTSRDDSGNTIYTATGRDSGHVIFTLTVHPNGSYTYVQSGAFADDKGSDNENFKIGFEVTDGDGDKATGSLTLNVADSLPVANNATADRLVNEDMLPGGNSDQADEYNSVSGASGSLFNMGADGFKRVTIAHSDLPQLTTIYTDADGVAHQEAVIWSKAPVADGSTTWVASSAHHETVATLTINADGSYTFSTGAPLAHPTAQVDEETLSLTFNFTVTDGDGDKATGSLTVGVKDDVPIAHTVDSTASPLNDDAQIGGNLDANDANVHSVSGAAGALFSAGADGFASVSIDQSSLPALKAIYVDANGFAQQEDVTWGKPTISGGATTWIASSANHETVATLTINADGSYTFSTGAPLVHPTSGTTEEGLPLTFTFTVTDGDNDTSTGSLTLHVTDDVPLAHTVSVTGVTLNDDALKGGNPDTVGVTDTDTVSGTSGTLFTGGADGVHQVTLGATTDFGAIYTGKDGFAHVESVVWGSPTTAAGGETIWIATGKDSGQTVATLTIGTDGSYSFTLSAPVAHQASQTAENTQDLSFNFTVTDGDSDTASGSLTVTVKDDAPIAFKVDTASTPLNDDAQAHGNLDGAADAKTINGDAGALFSAGADGVMSVSMDNLPTLKAIYLDSHGIGHQENVSWTSSATNGVTTWTATGASSHATVAVLTINSDGSYSFTADAPLVHSASSTTEDSLTLNFGFTVTDGDGDTAKGSLAIAITDDVPVASGATVAARADEGDIYNLLSHGNSALDGTHGGSSSQPALFGLGFAATVSGSVASTVSFGADGAAPGGGFSFTANAASTLAALHLTSGGGALSYAVVNNVIIGYVDNDHHSGYNPFLDRPVLSLTLSGDGSFTFQQYDQLDNVAGPGNDLRSGNSSISAIDFGSVIQATDGDGDSVTLTGALKVTIVDDMPKVDLALTGSITIDESGSGDNDVSATYAVKSLFAGIAGGSDPHMSTVYAQHNVVSPSVSMGADDASGATSSLRLHIDNADSGLTTTAGQAITLSQLADGTVVGKIADGEIAFAIRIDNSGKVSIAQYMALANPNTSKSDGDTVDLTGKLSAVLSATDSDGDTVARSVSIGSSIHFDDAGPSIDGGISAKTLVEHDLLTNSGSLSPSGISTGDVALNLAFGADGPAAHAATFVAQSNGSYFTASYGNNQTLDATKLSSGGHALSYSLSGDGMTLIAYTGSDAADQSSWVFKVALSQDGSHASGAYNFTLYKGLDDVNGQVNLADIKLTFQVAGHDGDGDTTNGTQRFTIDVIDDVPTLVDHSSVSASVSETAINAPIVTTGSYIIDFSTVTPAAAGLTITEGSVGHGHAGQSSNNGDIVLASNAGTTFVVTQMDITESTPGHSPTQPVTIIGIGADGKTYTTTFTPTNGNTTFSVTAGSPLYNVQLTSITVSPHDAARAITLDNIHVTDTTTTPTNAPAETTLDLTSLVHASADGPMAWSVNAITAGTSSGNLTGGTGLTYNGTAITLASADGHTITGSAGGVTVFTLTVDPTSGHATFDLYHPIDGGKTLPLDFSKYLTATDFDGDSVALGSGSATIVVQSATDSLPTISSASLVSSVSESGLQGGTGTAGVANVHSGSIAITAGDAPSTVTIGGHTFNVGAVIAHGDANANIQGSYGTLHIVSVTATAINYVYTLTAATNGASNHDDFAVKISDAPIDGESHTATLTFNISDDKPIASTVSLGSMLENDNPTFTLAAGTIAFGADGAAASGAIHVDSVKATGDLAGLTLSPSMISIDAGHVTITPGTAFDALSVGHTSILSIGYTLTDGDGSKSSGTFSIKINGTNDAAVIMGDVSGSVTEAGGVDNGTVGVPAASGVLSATDVDSNPSFTAQNNVATSYGHFTIGADGHWSYLLDNSNSAVQALNSTGSNTKLHDIVTVTTADGTSQQIDITINGTNDAPTIKLIGNDSAIGSVTETGIGVADDTAHNTATGHVTGADVDSPSIKWSLVAGNGQTGNIDGSVTGAYGTLSVDQNGNWTYHLDQSKADPLTASSHPQESFTVQLSDGQGGITTQTVVVTVNGTNDAPTIALVGNDSAAGSVTEAGIGVADDTAHNTATGHVTGADVDGPSIKWSLVAGNGQTGNIDGSVTGAYGTLSVDQNGNWTYHLDQSKANPLTASSHPQENFTVQLSDGQGGITTQTVVVTVNGTNDAASISGTASGSVTENGQLTATGVLNVADVDYGENHFQTPSSLNGTYGTFTFNATTGVWGYALNNSAANVQALNAGQTVTDKLTVASVDGTASQDIVVSVHGAKQPVSAPNIIGVTDNYGPIQGNLANGAITDDTTLGIRVSLSGTGAVAGDTVQLYNNTTVLGTAVILTSANISSGYVDIATPTLKNGSTYNFRASITDAGVPTALSPSDVYDIKIDTTHPTLVITQNSGVMTFTFSEAVSGFNINDVTQNNNYSLYDFNHVGVNASGQDIYTASIWNWNNGWKSASVSGDSYADLAGNAGTDSNVVNFKPAGMSGQAINLALGDPSNHVGAVTMSIAGVPAGWTLSEGTHNADGTWSVVTNNPSSLTVTSPDGVTGAVVLQITETWINADGTTGMATVADNVEAYAKGSPIFAWSGDDTLTASSGNDTLVFANTIGEDVVHNFDVAHDKIDLIGFAGFDSFADVLAHLSSDASGSAVITLGNGETITLAGVSAAALTADDFLFNEEVITHNAGDMVVANGALMPFSGTLDNTGSIHLSSTGSETAFEIVQHGLTLTGGGTVILSDDAHNVIFGSGDSVTLTNVDNIISGAGRLGDAHLSLVNEGTIIADGSHALVIDTGVNAVNNTGMLEATGAGGLDIHSSVINEGVLWADGGNIDLEGNVSGRGTVLLSGHASLEIGGSFSQAISLSTDAQATITIDHAVAFTGTIAGLDGNDALRFGDISAATASFSYTENAAKTGGVLIVTDGAHIATVGLTGDYSANDFLLSHDGAYAEIDFRGVGQLYGTDGNDTLTSGGGYTMTGGAGADTFVLDAKALHNLNMADVITDFSPKGEGDKLDVSNLLNALVGDHPGMTEASAVASMTAAVDTASNSTKISVNTGSETHVVATLQNYTPAGHDAVHVLFNNHDEQLATHAQTAGA
ncbi:VCBS domain-containing protein [Rhizobium sp. SG570]|uniref:T1SS-143 repeat domain-containing protein n=1 Tax=Rhizobium sp. SG570 TaxID=2587113 RepID=UPI00144889EB|nr:VCBS domain-containing protein [Rhizobium sp. SG570]NKJ37393.1 T1SS-143 domain-containing protein [Rhizobium sp. SG570]